MQKILNVFNKMIQIRKLFRNYSLLGHLFVILDYIRAALKDKRENLTCILITCILIDAITKDVAYLFQKGCLLMFVYVTLYCSRR